MNGHPPGLRTHGGAAHSHRTSLPGIPPPPMQAQDAKGMPSRPPGIPTDPNQRQRSMSGAPGASPFSFSRSPPSGKNTSHVPCKFFKLGNCQAGAACPFSHSTEPTMEVQPCKYFAKGNCKFGQKCALLHILSDGRVVNRPVGYGPGGPQFNGIGAPSMGHFPEQQQYPIAGSALQSPQPQHGFMQPIQDDYQMTLQQKYLDVTLGMEGVGSFPGHSYASSPQDGVFNRSPTIFAQPMPDLDPRSTSYYAKFGPVASSVPSKFGFGPLTSNSPTTSTVKSTAFGNLDSMARPERKTDAYQFGSSPPTASDATAARHLMPQERRRSKPQMISASVGASPHVAKSFESDALGDGAEYGEAYLPNSLSELFTPQERMRRFSRTEDESSTNTRQAFLGLGSPGDQKFGSVSNASPTGSSRFGALFARKRGEEGNSNNADGNPGFGHVGSPLRNSSLYPGESPTIKPNSRPRSRDHSPFAITSQAQAQLPGSRSSALSQQLSNLRLGSQPIESSLGRSAGAPGSRREPSDRAVSGGGVGRNGERTSEDAEQEEPCVFEMDEEQLKEAKRKNRLSGGSGIMSNGASAEGSGKSSPIPGSKDGSITGVVGDRDVVNGD